MARPGSGQYADEGVARLKKRRKSLKDLCILLVEDNPINQRIYTALCLNRLSGALRLHVMAKRHLDMYGTSRYDLILMDVQLPVMNGLVAAEKIRGPGDEYTGTRTHNCHNGQCHAGRQGTVPGSGYGLIISANLLTLPCLLKR